ncbi:outer membrane protein transport protein [Flaviramulus sp. BrNp1-15]|uniref:OmpP1/FadL family transporter n=1 Tax=Flaviramulus sp. BrNp1-15 TaxID=2916754 RepID=UPI001EE990E1|nr:outer membrane protein transport protein [Flaviramulus sp. BrNp1-15]ULC57851.1 outer membrane protein transport protein [Flaviramulus sp. BrNp1-15]
MKTNFINYLLLLFTTAVFSQAGHIMQGVGAVNMSMGGASTGQPLDISGALQWNPAAISAFDDKIIKLDVGLFFSSPELSSSLPPNMLWQPGDFGPGAPGSPAVYGTTEDDRGMSPMPALAMVWGKEGSKHTFGASAFGISGFGVTFPQETNLPMDMNGNPNPNWDPNNSNSINWPQAMNGFGHIESDYMLLQVGLSYAYEVTDKFSIGIQPNINYSALELAPNPTANPTMAGYPTTDKATAIGFGAQFGLFYDSGFGLKLGTSYKTAQKFAEFEFENTYLDNSSAKNNFQMDYPAIFSLGLGYSTGDVDLALDFRRVDYENTEGFIETGWTQTASVAGFGWDNISILSAGLQYKGINKLPLRFGYTYSSNPIPEEITFFNIPATAVIKNAYQFGFSYIVNDSWKVDAVYHYGDSNGSTEGQILSPFMASPANPLGAIPGSSISYEMTTSMIQFGISYTFNK